MASTALAQAAEDSFLVSHLSALLATCPPPFIFVHDPENPRLTASSIHSTLSNLASDDDASLPRFSFACVNSVSCFTPRLLYDTAINAFAHWTPSWDDGCHNWPGSSQGGSKWNDNFDAFVHGVQSVWATMRHRTTDYRKATNKGKGKARAVDTPERACRMVLVIERAERLRENLPEIMVPLTRLAEMAQIDITTIFTSAVQWEDLRPPLGASLDPYYIDIPFMSKQETLNALEASFVADTLPASSSHLVDSNAYHPALKPLYAHFLAMLYSVCAPFTHDLHELAYIAAARWPGFVQPVLDAYGRARAAQLARLESGDDQAEDEEDIALLPDEHTRIRLARLFTPSLTAALEALHPRRAHAAHWARTHAPPDDLLAYAPASAPHALREHEAETADTAGGADALPRMAKFVLVAAFLASTNAAKSDMRMFGRGPDARAKRRKRAQATPRKAKNGVAATAVKIPQRLLGPTSFPLDRLIAMLGVLLEENDAETRPVAPQYTLPGEYTEMEISRVAVYGQIMDLAAMRLLVRTSAADKLETNPTFRCGISYDVALKLARDLGIVLGDMMYEPM